MRSEEEIKKDIANVLLRKNELELTLQELNKQYEQLRRELFETKVNSFAGPKRRRKQND